MVDSLLRRAQLAIEESHAVQRQRRLLMEQHDGARSDLRAAVLESAMTRAEVVAYRHDRE